MSNENKIRLKNVLMIDIKKSGINPGCRVMTLGAYGFKTNGAPCEFYRRFDPVKLREAEFTDDVATMEWWSHMPTNVYNETFGGHDDPKEGIADFKHFCYENFDMSNRAGFEVWCCSFGFDLSILKEFFHRYGYYFPWKPWDQYDYRTLKKIFPKIRLCENNQETHSALEDARAQMNGLVEFTGSSRLEVCNNACKPV